VATSLLSMPEFQAMNFSLASLLGEETSTYRRYMEEQMTFHEGMTSAEGTALMLAVSGGDAEKMQQTITGLDGQAQLDSINQFVMGPAGSGGRFFGARLVQADVLIHGQRRWFFMSTERMLSLSKKAGPDFTPVSAFTFFEEQLEELMFEHGLKLGDDVIQCEQLPGDVILVPSSRQNTAVAMSDSFSYREQMVLGEAPGQSAALAAIALLAHDKIWSPSSQVYDAAACMHSEEWVETLGGFPSIEHFHQLVKGYDEQVDSPMESLMALKVLLVCKPLLTIGATSENAALCASLVGPCTATLEAKGPLPSWLASSAPEAAAGEQEL